VSEAPATADNAVCEAVPEEDYSSCPWTSVRALQPLGDHVQQSIVLPSIPRLRHLRDGHLLRVLPRNGFENEHFGRIQV